MRWWPIKVFVLSFVLAAIFSTLTNMCANMNILILLLIIFAVIALGILFDMIGVAVLTSKESNFHAMSSKKINGAKETISLLRNGNIVSSICNDVIGDICGIISGGLGAILTAYLIAQGFHLLFSTTIVTATISALTVGGKAYGKKIAMKKSDKIVFGVGKIKSMLHIK
ncbi:MAG: hypothetical protein HFH86_03350 [Bacilli bacterium]|jgi:CBS domain containing-hemolysin-like protein|nr:hypothetical protein [Bacilli bacterium]